jgi:virulence-associated protein VapD
MKKKYIKSIKIYKIYQNIKLKFLITSAAILFNKMCRNKQVTHNYRVRVNYRRISLRHNLSSKCRKVVKFVSITHSVRDIWNFHVVSTAISREKRKPVLEGNGCLTDRT